MPIQIVKSKLAKTEMMMEDNELRKYIPITGKLSLQSLSAMLSEHKMVYVKPDKGKGGVGVMRVEQLPEGKYKLRNGSRSYRSGSIVTLFKKIMKVKEKGLYLIQEGIHLLTYKGRSFDIRVLVQRNLDGEWETTGVIGRVAHPSKVVTNYYSGGSIMDYHKLMKAYLSADEQNKQLEQLHNLGLDVARFLEKKYPKIKEVGLDVALDSNLHPWLLEVNTIPNPFIFKKLKDKSIYRKIARYADAYGRFERRYCPELGRGKKHKLRRV